ncbi:MAG: hypothetical protein CM1200mP27_05410 [Chloroflexota bacterium]|nr:MAG: hypothetical protein CM1200mP27_05410 [Chloroflexota bacterium]
MAWNSWREKEVVSTRLGIELVVDPAFTVKAYRTRNVLCGQYGSWAPEMHMLRMSLISYFECSEIAVEQLANGIRRVAEESNNRSPSSRLTVVVRLRARTTSILILDSWLQITR